MTGVSERSVPVSWLVGRKSLNLRVVAGFGQVDRRMHWAHSIELSDPIPWLRGGELVLTTGLRLSSDSDQLRHYVRGLDAAGVSAIGFGVGLSHAEVPRQLIEEANRIGMPVLEVPLETSFVAVIAEVTDRLAELEYEGVVRASRALPKMARAALQRGGPGVVRELAEVLAGEVALVGGAGTLITAWPTTQGDIVGTALRRLGRDGLDNIAMSSVSTGTWGTVTVQALRLGDRTHGHLVVTVPHERIEPTDQMLLGHAVSLIAMELEKPRRLRDEQSGMNALLLSMLLDGTLSRETAGEYLRMAGMPDGPLGVMVVGGMSEEAVVASVERALLSRALPRFATTRGTDTVLLLPGELADLVEDVHAALFGADRSGGHAGYCAADNVGRIAEALRLASSAARSAEARRTTLIHAADLSGAALMTDPVVRASFETFAERRLAPLAERDQTTGSELVRTLRVFLEQHGQMEAAAGVIGVHRHTLRSRLERIRDVLDVDLDSAGVRAELLMALHCWSGSK